MGRLSNIDKASNLTGYFLISSSHYRQLMRSGIDQSMYFTMGPSSTVQYFFINANLWIEDGNPQKFCPIKNLHSMLFLLQFTNSSIHK